MHRIVFAFPVLEQHLNAVERTPQVYRPVACGHCGCSGVWCHGRYHRKADRSAAGALNPVPVLRFRCRTCSRTCSRLPLCIAPHRWYNWADQQRVLLLLLAGCSQRRASAIFALDRHTVRRWWQRLGERRLAFEFHLRSRFAELGRSVDITEFWLRCLQRMPLCEAMAWLDGDGVFVP
jgi:transposase-like protein